MSAERPDRLSIRQARRVAIAAQGLNRARPATVASRHLDGVLSRLALFQIDSVNVLTRAHHMPLFSRLGPYDLGVLHRAYSRAPRRLFEYWAHEAALVRTDLYPALRFRMRDGTRMWGSMSRAAEEHPGLAAIVLDELRDHGPLTARQVEVRVQHDAPPRSDQDWGWNWSLVKSMLEYLFYTGAVTSATRTSAFERVYDLPERVIPEAARSAPALDSEQAHRRLVSVAARAHGVATERGLRDYFRLAAAPVRTAVGELVEAGELAPVSVRGWRTTAYLHQDAVVPRRVRARALLSPFDPLVFERTRTEELFDFRYRIEIYVPAEKRVHGYYVLPFLLDERLVARVDLKADRPAGRLLVRAAFAEPYAPEHTAAELAAELSELARWLGLDEVRVEPRGDLAPALAGAVSDGVTVE